MLFLATAILAVLIRLFRNSRLITFGLICAVLFWCATVVFITVLNRTSNMCHEVCFIPLYSYWEVTEGGTKELLRTKFMNVALFYPGGVLIRALLPRGRRKCLVTAMVAFAFFSFSIETIQFFFSLGTPEIDDVLHNALGALLGWQCFSRFVTEQMETHS